VRIAINATCAIADGWSKGNGHATRLARNIATSPNASCALWFNGCASSAFAVDSSAASEPPEAAHS